MEHQGQLLRIAPVQRAEEGMVGVGVGLGEGLGLAAGLGDGLGLAAGLGEGDGLGLGVEVEVGFLGATASAAFLKRELMTLSKS
jgi:hypothetical protein